MIARLALLLPALGLSILIWLRMSNGNEVGFVGYIALAIAVILLCGVFIPANLRNLAAATVWASYCGALGADVFVLLTTPSATEARMDVNIRIWAKEGIEYDARTPLEVVKSLRDQGRNAFPKINPVTLLTANDSGVFRSVISIDAKEVLPVSTLSMTLNVWCNETGRYIYYQSDRFGFHNPDSVWDYPSVQFAILGDSFGEGACVHSSKNIAARIRRENPATVNLSMGGNGPLMQLAALSEVSIAKEPKVVIWLYFEGNDLTGLNTEWAAPLLRKYLSPSFFQGVFQMKSRIDESLTALIERKLRDRSARSGMDMIEAKKKNLLDFLLLRHLRVNLTTRFIGSHAFQKVAPIRHFTEVLRVAKKRVEAWEGIIVFVYLPSADRFRANGDLVPPLSMRNAIMQVAADLKIPTVDMSRSFEKMTDPLSLFELGGHGHFTPEGYGKVSDEILDFLRARQILNHQTND